MGSAISRKCNGLFLKAVTVGLEVILINTNESIEQTWIPVLITLSGEVE